MSAFSVFLLIGFAIAGVTLLVGAVKRNPRLFRRHCIVSGIAIGISALFTYALISARTGDQKIFWGLIGYLAQIAVCAVSGIFTLAILSGGKKDDIVMSARMRACCLGFAFVFFAGFFIIYGQKEIATMLQRRAVAAGSTSPLAKRIARDLKYWDAVARLEPSPQRERLVAMIAPSFWPPDGFWETLLSLPPSPERRAVLTAYAHGISARSGAKWLAALYDQGDTESLEIVFQKNEKWYFGYWLGDIVALNRTDILRDVLRRGRGKITTEGQSNALSQAVQKNYPEILTLLLDSGIEPDVGVGRSALGQAVEYSGLEVVTLLLERGADVNKDCLIMDAVRKPEVLSLLLDNGASPFCTRHGRTLLHQAADKNADAASMALILSLGLPIDALDKRGLSPLLLAARDGSSTALNSLAEAGADTSLRDAEGNTALHLAAKSRYLDTRSTSMSARVHAVMARLVALNPGLLSARNAEGKTALDYVKDEKSLAILRGEEKP